MKALRLFHMRNKSLQRKVALFLFVMLGLLLTACGIPKGATPSVGDRAPSFSLPSANDGTISIKDYRDIQPVLLYFHMADG